MQPPPLILLINYPVKVFWGGFYIIIKKLLDIYQKFVIILSKDLL